MRLSSGSLLAGMALLLAVGNFGRIPFIELGGRPGAISLMDLLLLPLWLLLLVKLPSGARRWRLEPVSRGMLLFIVAASVSTALAAPRWGLGLGDWLSSAAFLVRWVLYAGVFILISSDPQAPEAATRGWYYMERATLFIAVFGIVQVLLLPDLGIRMFAITGIPADPQGRRLVSTLFDPQQTGGLLAFALLIQVARVAEGLPPRRGVMLTLLVALLLTVSRSAILGFVAGAATIVMVRGFTPALRRLAVVGAGIVLPALPALVVFASRFNKLEVDGSAMQRIIPWIRGLTIIRDHPVFGAGFNAAAHAQRAYGWTAIGGSDVSMDGGLLFVTVMTGVVGLTAYCLMLFAVWRTARRTWRHPDIQPEWRAFAVGAVACTFAVLIQSFFTNTLLTTWVMLPLWVAWARVVACAPVVPARPVAIAGGRRVVPVGVSLAALVLLGGCEPCAGVASCNLDERRVLTGTILRRDSNTPRIGLQVKAEGRTAITNTAGRWVLELPPGSDYVEVLVGGDSGYTAPVSGVRSVRANGDGTEVGVWYDQPQFGFIVGYGYRGEFLPNPEAVFEIAPEDGGGTVVSSLIGGGYVRFSGRAPKAGVVWGRLTLTHPNIGTWVFDRAALEADYVSRIETVRGVIQIFDRSYRYGGNVVDRGTFENSPGTTVTFTRKSGLELRVNPVVATSREFGFFTFDIDPLGTGRVIGDLSFAPPNGRPAYVYRDVVLSTYLGENVPNLGLFAHGERWDWVVEVRRASDSSAVAWTPFEFVRTGGLALQSGNVITGSSNGSGRLLIRSNVRDTGTVTGVLTMRPEGRAPVTVGTFNLRTFAADTQNFAGIRFIPLP